MTKDPNKKNKIDLSIIIVSWNVKDLLRKCLCSIFNDQNGLTIEVFVIDNNSKDKTVAMIKKEFPQVYLIVNKENRGFAKANNQGIRQAQGDYILLLNPDTEILEDALTKMVELMKEKKEVGVGGCKILYPDTTIQLSVRRFPSLYAMIIISFKLHNFFPELVDEYFALDFDYYLEQEVDQVMGAFFMIRREVIDKVGLLDENYFMWFEEVDYCKMVKAAGYQIKYFPQAAIIHCGAKSFKQVLTIKRQKLLNVSSLYYFKKHHSWFAWLILFCLQPFSYLLSLIVTIFYGTKSGRSVN